MMTGIPDGEFPGTPASLPAMRLVPRSYKSGTDANATQIALLSIVILIAGLSDSGTV